MADLRHRKPHEDAINEEEEVVMKMTKPPAQGTTFDGECFPMPVLGNCFSTLALPWNWTWMSAITIALALASSYALLSGATSVWTHVAIAVFWRSMYNGFLGIVLRTQSSRQSVSKLYRRWTTQSGLKKYLAQALVRKSLPKGCDFASYPVDFQAWVAFRQVVDLILFNDFWNVGMLGLKCWQLPDSFLSPLVLIQYAFALGLFGFNYWAKVDAHRCIGDYSWYWGDFFFLRKQELTFDGIFELFPHPMYTVGYTGFYGWALLTRSFAVLFFCLAAHASQLLFLSFAEEPHIKKIYGTEEKKMCSQEMSVLYDKKHGVFRRDQKETVFFFDMQLPFFSDFTLLVTSLYCILACVFLSPLWCVVHAVAWKLARYAGMGRILWLQSKRRAFSRFFTDRGRTLYEAFDNWKYLFNLTVTLDIIAFVGAALRFWPYTSWRSVLDGWAVSSVLIGALLVTLSAWSLAHIYRAIGDFGWFYGDFFIPNHQFTTPLTYTGLYRFMNNPEMVFTHAGFFGVALMVQSHTMAMVAVLSVFLNMFFLNLVEIPHIESLYTSSFRKSWPLRRKLGEVIRQSPGAARLETILETKARKIRTRAMQEVFDIYKQLAAIREAEEERKETQWAQLEAEEEVQLGSSLSVHFKTTEGHADTDWLGVYSVETEAVPGLSEGHWLYVPPPSEGTVCFPPTLLPQHAGVYEVRYFASNSYRKVLAARPLQLLEPEESPPSPPELRLEGEEKEKSEPSVGEIAS